MGRPTIRSLRIRGKRMSPRQLADRYDLSLSTVYHWLHWSRDPEAAFEAYMARREQQLERSERGLAAQTVYRRKQRGWPAGKAERVRPRQYGVATAVPVPRIDGLSPLQLAARYYVPLSTVRRWYASGRVSQRLSRWLGMQEARATYERALEAARAAGVSRKLVCDRVWRGWSLTEAVHAAPRSHMFDDDTVRAIRAESATASNAELARKYGGTVDIIRLVRRRRTYRHVRDAGRAA